MNEANVFLPSEVERDELRAKLAAAEARAVDYRKESADFRKLTNERDELRASLKKRNEEFVREQNEHAWARARVAAAEAHNVKQSYDLDKAWEERDAAVARAESQLIDHALREADLLARAERAEALLDAERKVVQDLIRQANGLEPEMGHFGVNSGDLAAAKAQVARLREALENVDQELSYYERDDTGTNRNSVLNAREHARAVLQETGK